jgi:hypothetical protein
MNVITGAQLNVQSTTTKLILSVSQLEKLPISSVMVTDKAFYHSMS